MRGRRDRYAIIDGDVAVIKNVRLTQIGSAFMSIPKWWLYAMNEPRRVALTFKGDSIIIKPYFGEE